MYSLMIVMSLYKAFFIVFEFMHMKYEVPGLVKSVLMPTLLLIWAVIAFFTEGNTWYHWRKQVNDRPIAQFSAAANVHKHHKMDTTIHIQNAPLNTEQSKTDSLKMESHH